MLATPCNFSELDSLVRDTIVSGIKDLSLQEKLLRQANLTLKMTEENCRAAEISSIQVKEIRNYKEVDFLKLKREQVTTRDKILMSISVLSVVKHMERRAVQHLVKNVQIVENKTILQLVVSSKILVRNQLYQMQVSQVSLIVSRKMFIKLVMIVMMIIYLSLTV